MNTTQVEDFDAAAATWDDSPRHRERAEKLAAAVWTRVDLRPDMDVLDYGGATGTLCLLLAPDVRLAVAADASAGMVEVLKGKLATAQVDNVEAWHVDLANAPVPARRFALIVCCMTLHHVPDTRGLLQAFRALLEPGGTLVVADLDAEDGSFHGDAEVPHCGFDRNALALQLGAAGFTGIECDTFDRLLRETKEGEKEFSMFILTGRRET